MSPSRLIEIGDHRKDLLDDQRRQAERGLIEQEQLGPAHQRARDREHLLLAARQRAAALGKPLLQARKDLGDVRDLAVVIGAGELRTQAQVLLHRHARKDAPSFRRLGEAEPGDLDASAAP